MTMQVINALYLAIVRTPGVSAVMYDREIFEVVTEPDLDNKINRRLNRGSELVGVYNHKCGIRNVMDDVGVTLGHFYGK